MLRQEIRERGEEIELKNHINTDVEERLNWENVQAVGKGYIRDKRGKIIGREIARIPVEEAAMLEAMCDLDYLSFTRTQDKAALRRLLKRFPYWRCSEGGV